MSRAGKCKFQKWRSVKNQNHYWRLRSTENSKTIAIGGEGFYSEQECIDSINRFMEYLDSPLRITIETIADPNA